MPRRSILVSATVTLCASLALGDDSKVFEPPISEPLSGSGVVVYDELCEKLFRLDDGTLLSFTGLQEYALGDHLLVSGELCLICLLTPCGSPYSALLGAEIVPLVPTEGPPASEPFSGCVEVVVLQTAEQCGALLLSEAGTLYWGGEFVTPEQAGLRFLAQGVLAPKFQVLCPAEPVDKTYPFFLELTLGGCLGDLDADGVVDGSDLGLLLNSWNASCLVQDPCIADLDGSGTVDAGDLGVLLAAWS